MTDLIAPDDAGIARTADLLLAGRLVAFPTETVYGVAASAEDPQAIQRLREVKDELGIFKLGFNGNRVSL